MVRFRGSLLLTAAAIVSWVGGASAQTQTYNFDFPRQPLAESLSGFAQAAGQQIIFTQDVVDNLQAPPLHGAYTVEAALSTILRGLHLIAERTPSGALMIEHAERAASPVRLAEAAPARAAEGVESVVVTSSKIKGDIQTVPIAITALSQEQLTARQIAGGPDLIKEVPNLTFSKTNFTGYNIQIRGIGTQAISVTTDPAVAVAFNDIPFIRNHFFEQEFYDVNQVEVLRGPQGTLYGRNATAGVVNVISAKPTDQYEAQASVDVGNYNNRRLEGMLNIPIIGDQLDLRVAGEWTKRDGYTFNEENGHSIDGRDLWSSRITIGFKPTENLQAYLVWEHFNENDDRVRSSKQLCTRDPGPSVMQGPLGPADPYSSHGSQAPGFLEQGCLPGSFYTPAAFQAPNALAIPFVAVSESPFLPFGPYLPSGFDPYAGLIQSSDLRVIDSQIDPNYKAKNDTVEFNADWTAAPSLTLTSQTGYNKDFLYSTEDFNRFNTAPNILKDDFTFAMAPGTLVGHDGVFCDPQLGCSTRMIGEDISREHAWQFSQELRLASNYGGPLNFSVGANYLHYQTLEDYFVLFNLLSAATETNNFGVLGGGTPQPDADHIPFDPALANSCDPQPADPVVAATKFFGLGCAYIDPNPLSQIDGNGHNYFRSENPYRLNSWAGFGEVYYQVMPDLKLTGGLRWTDDRKHFDEIPSWSLLVGKGYPIVGVLNQEWKELTGRFNATWTPKLEFTDQSLFYASFGHGYKGGGANPPGVVDVTNGGGTFAGSPSSLTHPLTFKPEFINAYELGTKNTLLDGAMTVNADVFYYDYRNYQISQIVDRSSVNLNFNATVRGAEIESTWEPVPGLRFNFAGGYENARLANGSRAIDLMDRADKAEHPDWMVLKPFFTQTSNCVLPTYVVYLETINGGDLLEACFFAYSIHYDPLTHAPYMPNPTGYLPGAQLDANGIYPGFDPVSPNATNDGAGPAPNNGEGFAKNLSGNQLPNAPHFTVSLGGQYTMPLSENWAGTLRSDFYWQSQSFARVFNDRPYDKLRGYSTVNLALILTNSDGWEVMGYVKNVFDKTAITGAFLNSDDTALTTNVFVTDPRLLGLRITKTF